MTRQPSRLAWQAPASIAHTIAAFSLAMTLLSMPLRADYLVYPNGDRAEGRLIARKNGSIEFESKNFGRVQVRETDVHVESDVRSPPGADAAAMLASSVPSRPASDPQGAIPQPPASRWLDGWKGRVAFTFEMSRDASRRDAAVVDVSLKRTAVSDEVRLESRYEYREIDNAKNTDLMKGTVHWRHDLTEKWFGLSRSTAEWNRWNTLNGRSAPYLLLQQEIGAGRTILKQPDRSLRVGVAENLFYVRVRNLNVSAKENTESAFIEADIKLPWGSRLTERGVFYMSSDSGVTGWENTFELIRPLSRQMSIGLRHEYRRNVPDLRVQDYRNLRILLGYDF